MKTQKTNVVKVAVKKVAVKKVVTPKVAVKKVAVKKVAVKKESNGLHKALLVCNQLDKQENFSLSGALNRLKKQIYVNDAYKKIDVNLLNSALTFDNLLANVNVRCIDKQRFTVYALGLAVNKYLKNVK
jgi:hypothetical protein